MELDKRIKDITDIYSVTDGHRAYRVLNRKGYFANDINAFTDLKAYTYYGKFIAFKEADLCFMADYECLIGNPSNHNFRYFIPEDYLISEEKEYRSLTNEEFVKLFDSGKLHSIRLKDSSTQRLERLIITDIYVQGDYLYAKLNSSTTGYSPEYFFSNCEYLDGKEWKPFKVEK